MTSRERVLEAINHQPTDRTPAGFHANKPIWDAAYGKLGTNDKEDVMRHLGIDLRNIAAPYHHNPTGPNADGYMTDMWGVKRLKKDPQTAELEQPAESDRPDEIFPFNENTTVEDVLSHPWPSADTLDFSNVKAECEKYDGEYALYGAPWSPFFHEVGWMIGQENFYVWLGTKPEVMKAIIDAVVEYEVAATRRFLEAACGLIDIAYFGNDFGTQRGLFVSPTMFEQFFRLPLKRYFDAAHDYDCYVMKHSCGSVRAIIPWLIEDGMNILDPVQVQAAGMGLPDLVRDFGDVLTFHGGVDTQHTLPFGTVAEVKAEVRSYINLTREHGGYILNGSQNYLEDTPIENIFAIYEENRKK
jgi:uroporphyrinogen decarboxylase